MNRKSEYKNMNKWRENCRRSRQKNYARGDFGDGKRRKYTKEECKLILEHSMPDRELAQILHRSVQSIQGKRNRLKYGRDTY